MNDDLKKATSMLVDDTTLVLVKGDVVLLSSEKSVVALVEYIAEGKNYSGFSAADVVVGKAAALLLTKLKVKSVFAKTVSKAGKEILEKAQIDLSFEKEVSYIQNKKHDDMCPMEKLVADISNPDVAYKKIKEQIQKQRQQTFGFI